MNKEEIIQNIMQKLGGKTANFQVLLEFQMPLLGLDHKTIKNLRGKTGLDIGCGKGFLVEELRKKGILFEGIDPEAPQDKPYFICQQITSVHPFEGSIPREDNFYDVVTAFQCNDLNRGFTLGGVVRTAIEAARNGGQDEWHTIRYKHAQSALYEAIRVVKPEGRVIIYPCLVRLEETIGPLLRMQRISISREFTNLITAEEYLKSELPDPSMISDIRDHCIKFGLLEITILVKK